jgi:sterol desaturase/sphingolipid hydroxylase (fatty acid hydroxylase superfamily)
MDSVAYILTFCFVFGGIFGRYVLLALLFERVIKPQVLANAMQRQVQTRKRKDKQEWKEIGWSLLTSVLFACMTTLMLFVWEKGYTKIYFDIAEYPIVWFILSIPSLLLLHETYYYWLHRWMHLPGVYTYVHKVHHDSITTSAWTSFSFHPTESLLQAVFLPLCVLVLPVHLYALGVVLLVMTITSVINHLNTEVYPRDFHTHWFGKWWIGATHHSLHHSQFRYNYGLYFTFWDKWMKTESPDFPKLFEQKTVKEI